VRRQREVQEAMELAGFDVRCQIIWAKNTFAWGFGRYKFRHEPIYAHVRGESDAWYGDKSQSTLWEVDKPSANREHPTMKPVELIERAIVNSSRVGDVVVDLFGGSGSTLIGCERQKRKARLMEIDPRYVDVIISRWQGYCGQEAILEADTCILIDPRIFVGRVRHHFRKYISELRQKTGVTLQVNFERLWDSRFLCQRS
jgi:DNA modification methylase